MHDTKLIVPQNLIFYFLDNFASKMLCEQKSFLTYNYYQLGILCKS